MDCLDTYRIGPFCPPYTEEQVVTTIPSLCDVTGRSYA